jgi:hypothetical protein
MQQGSYIVHADNIDMSGWGDEILLEGISRD